MSFPTLTLAMICIIFLFTLVTSQRPQFIKSANKTQTNNSIDTNDVDQYYIDGCAAIMQGMYDVYTDGQPKDIYSTWENQNLYKPFLGYFDSHNGVIRERWLETSSGGWHFWVTLYDGNYIDKKFATMSMFINNLEYETTIDRYNGTIKTISNFVVGVNLGDNGVAQKTDSITGQLSLYFIRKGTGSPIVSFDEYDTDISSDTVQISFVSSDLSVSFTTSLFYRNIDLSMMDIIIYSSGTVAYIIISLFSYHSVTLSEKVSVWSVRLTYLSSFYIMIWTVFQLQVRMGLLVFMLLLLAIFDWFKQFYFVIKKDSQAKCATIVLMPIISVYLASLSVSRSIWVNLFPSFALLLPLLHKMGSPRRNREPYLTRFQISNWLCLSIWMAYTYLNPYNIFLFSPKPMLAGEFLGIICLQFLISIIQHKRHRPHRPHIPLLAVYDDYLVQPAMMPRPNVQPNLPQIMNMPPNNGAGRRRNQNLNNNLDAVAAQRRAGANNQRVSNRPANRPRRKQFKYTFASGEENYTVLTDECAICFDYLLGESQDKLYKTPCGHIFHEGCLRAWGIKKLDCPCCRKKLPRFKKQPNN